MSWAAVILIPCCIAALWYFSWTVQPLQVAIGVIGSPIVFGSVGYAAWQGYKRQRWERSLRSDAQRREAIR